MSPILVTHDGPVATVTLNRPEAMALEHARSAAANRSVRAEDVERRRLAVMERGRERGK
jgi:enoyl-CoA hydratase/carnithine racemase